MKRRRFIELLGMGTSATLFAPDAWAQADGESLPPAEKTPPGDAESAREDAAASSQGPRAPDALDVSRARFAGGRGVCASASRFPRAVVWHGSDG